MSLHTLSTTLDAILVMLLLVACVTDWRARIIPHWLNISIALLAPVTWWVRSHYPGGFPLWPDVSIQIAQALIVFLIFAGFQLIGQMGGGDVKLLGALALWFNWKVMFTLLFFMALAGGVLTVVLLIVHRRRKREGNPEIPYGIAIASGALIVVCEPYLNHFR